MGVETQLSLADAEEARSAARRSSVDASLSPSERADAARDASALYEAMQRIASEGSAGQIYQRVIDRWLKSHRNGLAARACASVSKGTYATWAGRSPKVIAEHAQAYGIPIPVRSDGKRGASPIDMAAVVQWLHQWLVDNGRAVAKAAGDDPDLIGPDSLNRKKLSEEKWKLARLDRMEREGKLVPADDCRVMLQEIAMCIRRPLETLERQCGAEARDIMDRGLDEMDERMDRLFGVTAEEESET